MHELDQIENFFHNVIEFVESYTVFKNYNKMTEDKKTKYVEKLTLMVIFETSPRKNYDISKETIRLVIRDILDKKAAEVANDE